MWNPKYNLQVNLESQCNSMSLRQSICSCNTLDTDTAFIRAVVGRCWCMPPKVNVVRQLNSCTMHRCRIYSFCNVNARGSPTDPKLLFGAFINLLLFMCPRPFWKVKSRRNFVAGSLSAFSHLLTTHLLHSIQRVQIVADISPWSMAKRSLFIYPDSANI